MVYGYSRVSTEGQRDNNSLEAQERQLKDRGAELIYSDVMSGAKMDRPQLTALLDRISDGDRLIVCKLDRIARTATEGFNLITSLIDRGITVEVLNIGIMDNSPTGKLIMQIFLAFSEYERDMIRTRMIEGKMIARQKDGYREGRPKKYTTKQMDHAMDLLRDHSYKQVSEIVGISVSTLAREHRRRSRRYIVSSGRRSGK